MLINHDRHATNLNLQFVWQRRVDVTEDVERHVMFTSQWHAFQQVHTKQSLQTDRQYMVTPAPVADTSLYFLQIVLQVEIAELFYSWSIHQTIV